MNANDRLDGPRATRLKQILAHQGHDRAFLADAPLRNARRDQIDGFELTVRLTSYRALPLSCIAEIKLIVDGKVVDASGLRLMIQGSEYRVADFPSLAKVWWFVLDTAVLFVPWGGGLSAGAHEIEGTLVTVEPYMTAGRFAFYSSSRKRLPLQSSSNGEGI